MVKVKLYTKDYCPYCKRALSLLESYVGEDGFENIDALQNEEEFEEIKTKTGSQTVPQIFIDDKFIGGCDELFDLHNSGKLKELLG